MGGSKEGAKKRLATQRANSTDKFNEYGAKGGAKSKGRKLSAEHKRKLREAYRRNNANLKTST